MHTSDCTSCNCSPVTYVDQVKYLGIQFDNALSWNFHLAHLCKRLRNVACLLYNCRSFIPTSTKKAIAQALAYSVLRYGITIFGHGSTSWNKKINTILKGMFKSIVYGTTSESEEQRLADLHLPLFNDLLFQTIILKYFWSNDFKIPHVIDRSLRRIERYEVPYVKTKYGKRIRNFYVPSVFNGLPDDAYEVNSRKRLKQVLQCINETL